MNLYDRSQFEKLRDQGTHQADIGRCRSVNHLFLLVPPARIDSLIRASRQHELSKDPNDLIATVLVDLAEKLTVSVSLFSVIYLL